MQKKEIIVFDFDGVVCDSTDECMVSAWNAWEIWEDRAGFRRKLSEFSDSEKAAFGKIRPYVRGAGEYYILKRAQAENIVLNGQVDFDKYAGIWKEFVSPFKDVFFECRNKLRGENLLAWIELHPVFQEVIEVLKELNRQNRLYIATLKDGKSVKLILNHYGINIPDNHLLDQSQIKSKLQALDTICDLEDCVKNDILFLDDNLTHLIEPHKAGYTVYLTTWGSVLPEFIRSAQEYSISLIDMEKVSRWV